MHPARLTASLVALALGGCAAQSALLVPEPTAALAGLDAAPTPDLFARDRAPGGLSEEDLRRLLEAPVVLEEHARVGVVPVQGAYDADRATPVVGATGPIAEALGATGHFEFVTEVSTDWPSTTSIAGLRELAARNRCDYLLLYRHRFVDRSWLNPWAWTWLTLVGIPLAPASTREAAGVLEATLFDVKSGTILFTVFERVHAEEWTRPFDSDRHERELREGLLARAAEPLAKKVVERVQQLVATRPATPEAVASANAADLPR